MNQGTIGLPGARNIKYPNTRRAATELESAPTARSAAASAAG